MAPGGMVGSRHSSAGSSSLFSSAHRCLSFGLGGPSPRSDSIRGIVSGGEPPSHQCAGDEDCGDGVGQFSPPVCRADHFSYE